MRKVVVNSTPIIILSRIGKLELLKELYGEIQIPEAVFDEVTKKSDPTCINIINRPEWIKILSVNDKNAYKLYHAKLHAGEVEVMILAQENETADLVIIDDNAAKKTAKYLGLKVTGTLGVLLKAKKSGLISDVSSLLFQIKGQGFYISDKVVNMVLEQANEL